MGWLKGKKTYVTGVAWILWGAFQFLIEGEQADGAQRVLEGISLLTLRAGISKSGESASQAA